MNRSARDSQRIVSAALLAALAACTTFNDQPTGTIEMKYAASGPRTVATMTTTVACDHKGDLCDVYYPASLGGSLHPIITWGNGTFGTPANVDYLLRHLASWGFVVIATRDGFTGDGTTILEAAKFLITANGDSHSPFFGALDTLHVGAIGHSQGAGGVLRAMIASGGTIMTAIPIELPAQWFCFCGNGVLDTASITTGSVFFVDGSNDIPVSPPIQLEPASQIGEESLAAFYAAVPAGVPKLTATLIGPAHNDITGQPGCNTAAAQPCVVGVYGYLGYPTAWMADRLGLDASARAAFTAGTGEIFFQTSHWSFVQSNI